MKRGRVVALACLVSGCMPVHDIPLGSDGREVAVPDAAVAADSATVGADVREPRSPDQHDVDDALGDGGPPDVVRRDDDDAEDRSNGAGPALRDAALGGEDADTSDTSIGDGSPADGATTRDAATDAASRDDDDDQRDAGQRRDDDDRP